MSTTTVERAWTPASVENNLHKPDESTASIFYIVREAEDELTAIAAVQKELGDDPTYNDLPIHAISVDDRLTENDWKIEVKFQKQNESNS